jgi:hypothetical protein
VNIMTNTLRKRLTWAAATVAPLAFLIVETAGSRLP